MHGVLNGDDLVAAKIFSSFVLPFSVGPCKMQQSCYCFMATTKRVANDGMQYRARLNALSEHRLTDKLYQNSENEFLVSVLSFWRFFLSFKIEYD